MEQTQDVLVGLRSPRQRGPRQLLAILQREQVGALVARLALSDWASGCSVDSAALIPTPRELPRKPRRYIR